MILVQSLYVSLSIPQEMYNYCLPAIGLNAMLSFLLSLPQNKSSASYSTQLNEITFSGKHRVLQGPARLANLDI